jgi:hypothetical protein
MNNGVKPTFKSFTVRNTNNGSFEYNRATKQDEWVEGTGYSKNLKVVFVAPDEGFSIPTLLEHARIADWQAQKASQGKTLLAVDGADYQAGTVTKFDARDGKPEAVQVIYRAPQPTIAW